MQTAEQDFTPRVEKRAAERERAWQLSRRDREHGGTVPADRAREDAERAFRDWQRGYKPVASEEEVKLASAADRGDVRARRTIEAAYPVKLGRLAYDVHNGVKRWSRFRREYARSVEQDALALLLTWSEQGSADSGIIDLGGRHATRCALLAARRAASSAPVSRRDPRGRAVVAYLRETERAAHRIDAEGTYPLKRDWLDPARRDANGAPMQTALARRATRAAIKQASDALTASLARVSAHEMPVGEVYDVSAAIDAEKTRERVCFPETPHQVKRLLGVSVDAARAVLAARFPSCGAQLAESWSMSPATLKVSLSRGREQLHQRYPDPSELADALEQLSSDYRAELARSASMALARYRPTLASVPVHARACLPELERERDARERARWRALDPDIRDAVADWIAAAGMMPNAERAELAAARLAIRRDGALYSAEIAERIAASARRIVTAEQRAAKRTTRVRPTAELARTYPGASWRVSARGRVKVTVPARRVEPLAVAELARLARIRAELAALLDTGSSDADRIRELRAELASEQRRAQDWRADVDWRARPVHDGSTHGPRAHRAARYSKRDGYVAPTLPARAEQSSSDPGWRDNVPGPTRPVGTTRSQDARWRGVGADVERIDVEGARQSARQSAPGQRDASE